MPINTVQELRDHLALAAKIELSLVPPYLYAMYSIEDQDSEAARLIKSVVVEEMLHASLATNLLLAIGGEPEFRSPEALPDYPHAMPHHIPELQLNLEPCSEELFQNAFIVIERPEAPGAVPEEDYYETQGQFYFAIEQAFIRLAAMNDLFEHHQPERQLSKPSHYGTVEYDAADSGGLVLVENIESAVAAIEIVVHQGEGLRDERWADPDHKELTHYYKFLRIADGTSPMGAVRPALHNPKTAELPVALRPVSDLFNATNQYLYLTMHELFAGSTDTDELVVRLYTLMSAVLSPIALYLMHQPVDDGRVAGLTFERYDLGDNAAGQMADLAESVATAHPSLGAAAELLASV